MNQNTNNVAQNSSDKSQWTSPEVWDLAVGRTQGGLFNTPTEGTVTGTIDGGGTFTAPSGPNGSIIIVGAS